jgi:hypothetical protein
MSLWKRLFGPPDPAGFARLMERTLRRAGETGRTEYDPKDFALRIGGSDAAGGPHTLFLANAYTDYCRASRSDRREVLRRYAAVRDDMAAPQATFADVRPNLLPRVQARAYCTLTPLQLRLQGAPEEKAAEAMPYRPFSEHLGLTLVVDHPDSIQTVAGHLLVDWKVSFDEVLAVAKENLWSRSNQDFGQVGPGLWLSPWQDTHDASRLFLHDLIWQLPVTGRHVAMAPNRNVLLVAGDEDPEALLRMADLADRQLQEPRPLSGHAVRLEGNRWEPFLPATDHPAYMLLRQAAMRSAMLDYAEQKRVLDALHAKTGQDVFVASLMALRGAADTVCTGTAWVDAVTDALMPEADVVAFSRPPGEKGEPGDGKGALFADWPNVRRVAGDLMEPTDLYPTRYRVKRFPTPEQLREMDVRDAP